MNGIFIGASLSGEPQVLPLRRANRHGLIAGATGTGKTVTVQGLIEGFSAAGVPCFVADVKGDLSGLAMPGSPQSKLHAAFAERAARIGDAGWAYRAAPVQFWDLYGEQGHPIRTTVSEMGPLLLARLLGLNETQEGVLAIAFHLADAEGLLLLDLDDLQSMLAECAARASELTATLGNVSKQSVGAIQRALLQLRAQGGDEFFGEPALDLADFLSVDEEARGVVNILAADKLMAAPKLYATFLLWLLSELWETLPEIGDPDKPVLVFVFDEAHLLFDDVPPALVDKVEQVVRLIRSKGVGVYFVTQNPLDIPDGVGGQLGHRVQHALRAFTPREQAAVRAAATTFRANPDIDVETAITELAVGEALVSLLQPDGAPSPIQRTLIRAPGSRVAPVTPAERRVLVDTDAVGAKYDVRIDRDSAHEILTGKAEAAAGAASAARAQADAEKAAQAQAKAERAAQREQARLDREATNSPAARMTRSATSAVGRQVASEITRAVFGRSTAGRIGGALVRGILGGLFRGR
jgi:hypothetical protein